MALQVIARSGGTLMIGDPDAGPGVILALDDRSSEPAIFHRDTALARGYWNASGEPVPRLSISILEQLHAFNERATAVDSARP